MSSKILLTGANGIIGAAVLKVLLRRTSCSVVCLVRGSSSAHAGERLQSVFSCYDPRGELTAEFNSRVEIVTGDVIERFLGLESEQYDRLLREVTTVIHCAACTNLFQDFEMLKRSNVDGTQHIVDFCLCRERKHLNYISTSGVMGEKVFERNFCFTEAMFDIGQEFRGLPYQKTKFLAEKIIRDAAAQGLSATIVRPGYVFGDASSGAYPLGMSTTPSLFYEIFRAAVETGVMFHSEYPFEIVPVDFVAEAIVALGILPHSKPVQARTYHLANPDTKTLNDLMRIFCDLGFAIEFIPQPVFRQMLREGKFRVGGRRYKNAAHLAYSRWFDECGFDFQTGAVTSSSDAIAALTPLGITCPPITHELFETYLSYAAHAGFSIFNRRHDREVASGKEVCVV